MMAMKGSRLTTSVEMLIPASCTFRSSRAQGADPAKLHRQIALFGRSADGMPPPSVYEGTDGVLVL